MGTGHQHSHSAHAHDPAAPGPGAGDAGRRAHALGIAIAITFVFAAVEAIGGWWAGSLALLGDAGHMVTDSAALLLSFLAARLAQRPPSAAMSYGWRRAEVMAALLNALFMLAVVAVLVITAIDRLRSPVPVQGGLVMLIAALGLLVNLLVLWQLHGAHSHALNMRGAVLHVIGDLLGSVAALASGLVVWLTGWVRIDPLLTLLICALILLSALRLLRDVLAVLMEATPAEVDLNAIRERLRALDGLEAVHDLHVWTLAGDRLLLTAQRLLRDEFGIAHATLQPESPAYLRAAEAAGEADIDDHCH